MNNFIDLFLIVVTLAFFVLIAYGMFNLPSQIKRFKAFLSNGGYKYTILAIQVDTLTHVSLKTKGYSERDTRKKFRSKYGSRYKIVGVDKNDRII